MRSNDPSFRRNVVAWGTITLCTLTLTLTCTAGVFTVGPDYTQPAESAPANYKAAELGSWKEGRPLDNVPKGNWWQIFGDNTLHELESQALEANQDLKAAV